MIEKDIFIFLGVQKELTVDFFGVFSRFEYALKRAGYIVGDEKNAAADWDSFAADLRQMEEKLKPVFASCSYLHTHKPKKQVKLLDGSLGWGSRNQGTSSAIENLLLDIRTVRNNVFHGGKFPLPAGPVVEPLRDTQLIADCLAALKALLHMTLPRDVEQHFWE